MTDLEITKACAEAMGFEHFREGAVGYYLAWNGARPQDAEQYNPLANDAQAMALVKKLGIHVEPGMTWAAHISGRFMSQNEDLNRAICECVAKIQATLHGTPAP